MKAGRAKIGIFQKKRIKNLRGEGGQWGSIKKSSHPQVFAQRAPEG